MESGKARPDTRLLLQAALVAQDRGVFRDFHYPAYRARWAEARPVDDPAVVRALLQGAGLEAGPEYLLTNSFGFGGVNATLLLRRPD